jgi:hypothetical protein
MISKLFLSALVATLLLPLLRLRWLLLLLLAIATTAAVSIAAYSD